jgi:hypothetical protein
VRLWLLAAVTVLATAAAPVMVGDFSAGSLQGWTSKRFKGETRYRLVTAGGRTVLRAVSHAAASGLYKRVHVDLDKTPYLHWSWKVENTLGPLRERTRGGDDYPARVYVVFSGGLLFWRTRAINYVWSNDQPVGSEWPNAYTDHDRMVAVASGKARAGQWVHERRNVHADFRRLFGENVRYVDAVALMTDTDNSGKSATAYYGDIYFSAR